MFTVALKKMVKSKKSKCNSEKGREKQCKFSGQRECAQNLNL